MDVKRSYCNTSGDSGVLVASIELNSIRSLFFYSSGLPNLAFIVFVTF